MANEQFICQLSTYVQTKTDFSVREEHSCPPRLLHRLLTRFYSDQRQKAVKKYVHLLDNWCRNNDVFYPLLCDSECPAVGEKWYFPHHRHFLLILMCKYFWLHKTPMGATSILWLVNESLCIHTSDWNRRSKNCQAWIHTFRSIGSYHILLSITKRCQAELITRFTRKISYV